MLVCGWFDERLKQLLFLFPAHLVQDVSNLFGHMISVIIKSDGGCDYTRHVEFYRRTFYEVAAQLNIRTFRRMFRMDCAAFDQLCEKFLHHDGVDRIRPQQLLTRCGSRMFKAHVIGSGGLISGKTLLAVFIKLVAGGSY